MKTVFKLMIVACLSMLSMSAVAAADVNKCGDLSVQLTTPKRQSCTLMDSEIVNGNLIKGTSIPITLTGSGAPQSFELRQTVKGPDVKLRYQCGKKIIDLEAQQNVCVLQPGKITASSSSEDTQVETTEGDWLNSAHGVVSWVVK